MKISESQKIINNGNEQTQSITADYDGEHANIMVSKNGDKQYTTLSKNDMNKLLSFKPNENDLFDTLKKDFTPISSNAMGNNFKPKKRKTKHANKKKKHHLKRKTKKLDKKHDKKHVNKDIKHHIKKHTKKHTKRHIKKHTKKHTTRHTKNHYNKDTKKHTKKHINKMVKMFKNKKIIDWNDFKSEMDKFMIKK
jgi:hypothetical protein